MARRFALLLVCLSAAWALTARADDTAAARAEMVETIREIAEDVAIGKERRPIDARVLEVMGRIPRHDFVPPRARGLAYADRPLPIGHGQTISQPYIVALMTDLLQVEADHVVLEIGTGSGYQAAVLSPLVRRVHSIEIITPLAETAAQRLADGGYANVQVRAGDGYYGWPEAGPFDAIVVTAAASHVPPPLVRQLKPGGRMVIPVGASFMIQHLMLVEKDADGAVHSELLLPVRFVPLTGGH